DRGRAAGGGHGEYGRAGPPWPAFAAVASRPALARSRVLDGPPVRGKIWELRHRKSNAVSGDAERQVRRGDHALAHRLALQEAQAGLDHGRIAGDAVVSQPAEIGRASCRERV